MTWVDRKYLLPSHKHIFRKIDMNQQVTVLMALYNGGEYLKQSVQSVLNQTYPHFEFLIINDGSTDNSLKTIQSFHDERIKIHNNLSNMGQTQSLNVGLKLAWGDYIARIDADDIALPGWLEAQVGNMQKNPGHSVVSSYAFAIDEQNNIKKLYKPPMNRDDIILRSLIASPIHHVGSIFKKEDIMANGGYDERCMIAADYDLWSKLLRNGFRMTTTPKILMAIREHAQSLSRSERGKRELEEITEIAQKNINKFVSMKFSGDEVALFCRANYDEENLTAAEFKQAVEVTKRVYINLASFSNVRHPKAMTWMRKRCVTIYLKRIFFLIRNQDYEGIRELSRTAMKEFGPLSFFTIFWGASFFSGTIVTFIPQLYNVMLRVKACLGLSRKSII